MYRPRKGGEEDEANADDNMAKLLSTNKFKPDKDFSGVDRTKANEVIKSGPYSTLRNDTETFFCWKGFLKQPHTIDNEPTNLLTTF